MEFRFFGGCYFLVIFIGVVIEGIYVVFILENGDNILVVIVLYSWV